MSKLNQKIVLFIESADQAWSKHSQIGNLLMNLFAIDEDAKNEILKIYHPENNFEDLFKGQLTVTQKGLDLINSGVIAL